jgi:hypothetical protein
VEEGDIPVAAVAAQAHVAIFAVDVNRRVVEIPTAVDDASL